jgi:DNA-binding NarL/FixJ family response regulator
VSVSLPQRGPAKKKEELKTKRAIRVLVVDDSPVVQAGMKAMLRAPDIRVVGAARTGREALLAMRKQPSIVLVNLRSDEPEGLDLVAQIKKSGPKASVVIVTKSKSTQYLARAIALGCSGYLHSTTTGTRGFKGAVRAIARGECVIDPSLLRELLKEMGQERSSQSSELRGRLSAPEQEVLQLITLGRKNRQIAVKLAYSIGSVKDYVQKIIQKLEVSDRTQAAVKAVRLGLVK